MKIINPQHAGTTYVKVFLNKETRITNQNLVINDTSQRQSSVIFDSDMKPVDIRLLDSAKETVL